MLIVNLKKIFLVFIFSQNLYSQVIDLSQDWNINSEFALSEQLENVIASEIATLPNTKGFIVIHRGEIVSENYYNSSESSAINIWSVTKSFISTLVGQAVDMGLMHSPDSSANYFFPNQNSSFLDTLTLHHLLTMSSGYVDQFVPYDPITFFFDPGQWWVLNSTETLLSMESSELGNFYYNNSACHLNAHALYYSTGMTPLEFGNEYLFPHLGINNPIWDSGYLDINDGSAMLYLTLRDMVKLGQLYLQNGYSGENQILSDDWIELATQSQVNTGEDEEYGELNYYGYLWWLPDSEGSIYSAQGLGGQIIAVFPEYELVIGAHSDIYGQVNLDGFEEISQHSYMLNYKIIDEIAPLFADYASQDMTSLKPNLFDLKQNYPNPFNPITTISYDLFQDSFVNIVIYDMLGNVVKNFTGSNQSSGYSSIQWDATDNQGKLVSAGVYLYKIQAGDFTDTKKMILLK